MKYHRNFIFRNDLDNRPISMIVTTLAAKNYDGEQDLVVAFSKICAGIKSEAQEILNSGILLNPVDSRENFADAWKRHPKRRENFRIWVEKLEDLTSRYSHVMVQNSKTDLSKLLFEHLDMPINWKLNHRILCNHILLQILQSNGINNEQFSR